MEMKDKKELSTLLHMKGGDGENSYAQNSSLQRNAIELTKGMKEEAIKRVYNSLLMTTRGSSRKISLVELGCSTGSNALMTPHEVITTVDQIRRECGQHDWSPEFQVFLNDLPGNDFNTLFRAVPGFLQQLNDELGPGFGTCFVNGVPGSFYGRLFPIQSLDFVHASSCLHWLSQVPEGKDRSEESVGEAFYEQFQSDFTTYLTCRSEEMVSGGCMIMTFVCRRNKYPRNYEHYFPHCSVLKQTLLQMTSQGLIEEDKMKTFDMPLYAPTLDEVETEIKKQGSFTINRLEYLVSKDDEKGHEDHESKEHQILTMVKGARSIFEPFLINHFGKDLSIDHVFQILEEIIRDCNNELRTRADGVAASVTRN